MGLEVEVKAPCERNVEEQLMRAGANFLKEEHQEDLYFNHPARDFRETDEALRIRRVDDKFFLTYKGSRLFKKTKTREEFEIPVAEKMYDILIKLGFKESAVVVKTRRYYRLQDFEVCVDDVKDLGLFIEVELANIDDEDTILDLMQKLGVPKERCTTKTYLELLEEGV